MKYTVNYTTRWHDTDACRRVRPSALLVYMQETSNQHVSSLGTSLDELHEQVQAFTEKVEASFVVDKLDDLVKGGRCSSAAALGANLLTLKPCIEVKDGKMSVVKKYRGNFSKCLTSYVKERLEDRDDIDHSAIFVVKTVVSDDCYNGALESVNACGQFETVYEEVAGCTVSCHCGPGTLGIIFVRK